MVYFPPASIVLPNAPFDGVIAAYGIDLNWQKSHLCPCIYGGPITGAPDPACQTCLGRGWYWDAPSDTFRGLITFIHLSPSPDEPGTITSDKFGMIDRGEPTLTIPQTAAVPYANASVNDIYTEVGTHERFQAELQAGGNTLLPYQQGLSVPASGAVTVYDSANSVVVSVSGYVVSGAQVTLPGTYPTGTSYIVSYTASKAYVAYRIAGATPHERPFANLPLPKRFRLQALDLWLRGSGKI